MNFRDTVERRTGALLAAGACSNVRIVLPRIRRRGFDPLLTRGLSGPAGAGSPCYDCRSSLLSHSAAALLYPGDTDSAVRLDSAYIDRSPGIFGAPVANTRKHAQGVLVTRQNFRHMKKQKEESRKTRQAEKRQRRQGRMGDASTVASAGDADTAAAADVRNESAKTD